MSLLPAMILYLAVGCGEWYLALRRTLACARGEKVLLVSIVFIENLLGLWVLSNFIRTNNWFLALSYSAGASAGALIVAMKNPEKPAKTTAPPIYRPRVRTRARPRSFIPAMFEHVTKMRPRWPRLSLGHSLEHVEPPP